MCFKYNNDKINFCIKIKYQWRYCLHINFNKKVFVNNRTFYSNCTYKYCPEPECSAKVINGHIINIKKTNVFHSHFQNDLTHK